MQERRDAFNESHHLKALHSTKEEGTNKCYLKNYQWRNGTKNHSYKPLTWGAGRHSMPCR